VAVGRVLNILGDNAEPVANSADKEHEIGHVNAERAIHDASPAKIAFGKRDFAGGFDKRGRNIPFFAEDFPDGLLDFASRRISGITVIGQIMMACLAAKPAMSAGVHINPKPGPALGF
jgi:hypothetical protein